MGNNTSGMKMLFIALGLSVLMLILFYSYRHTASAQQGAQLQTGIHERNTMKIRLIVDQHVLTATLVDSPTTQDFIAQLPLTLLLEDYAAAEKIANLPQRLSTKGAPAGYKPSKGAITYYAPWGNLALFYKDASYGQGLIILGQLDDGIDVLQAPEAVRVKIEFIE